MIPMRTDSRIEIWNRTYINNLSKRKSEDQNIRIIQIEPASVEDDYIVEIADKKACINCYEWIDSKLKGE